jgi:capsid protein
MYQLRTGESMTWMDLKTPSNNFGLFNEWIIKLVAMATDTTPGVIMSNYPTSYSSHRGEFNDFWKMIQLKRTVFNDKVNRVVIREIAKKMILDGVISAPGFFNDQLRQEAWLAGAFLGPVPGHINPLQEINAQKVAVEESFITRADAAALHGNEWENTIDEWHEQENRFRGTDATVQADTLREEMQDKDPNEDKPAPEEEDDTK